MTSLCGVPVKAGVGVWFGSASAQGSPTPYTTGGFRPTGMSSLELSFGPVKVCIHCLQDGNSAPDKWCLLVIQHFPRCLGARLSATGPGARCSQGKGTEAWGCLRSLGARGSANSVN